MGNDFEFKTTENLNWPFSLVGSVLLFLYSEYSN